MRASSSRGLERSRKPGFAEEVDTMLATALRRAAEDYHLWAWSEQNAVKDASSERERGARASGCSRSARQR